MLLYGSISIFMKYDIVLLKFKGGVKEKLESSLELIGFNPYDGLTRIIIEGILKCPI